MNNQNSARTNLSRLKEIQAKQRELVSLTAKLESENFHLLKSVAESNLAPPESKGSVKPVDLVISLRDEQIDQNK